MKMFQEAMSAKLYGNGAPFGRQEFDKWTGDYDVRQAIRAKRSNLTSS